MDHYFFSELNKIEPKRLFNKHLWRDKNSQDQFNLQPRGNCPICLSGLIPSLSGLDRGDSFWIGTHA